MSTKRGRIRITGFDTEQVRQREDISTWSEDTDTEGMSRWRRAWRRFRRNRVAMLGLAVVVVMSLLAIFARPIEIAGVTVQPISLAPYDPTINIDFARNGVNLEPARYHPPSPKVILGTDGSGRGVFSRLLAGGRQSISIGFIVVIITGFIGLVYGAVAGYFGGLVDDVMMRVVDTVLAFPGLLLALVVVAVFGKGYWQLVLAFTAFGWAGYARLIRGEVLSVKENEYVLAARALGATNRKIIFRHVVPNSVAPLIVQASLAVGTVVIGVAALGFLGLGLPPNVPEWGTMLQGADQTLVTQDPIPWWTTIYPGLAIFLFVMSMNMIGDGINDALDAQQTGSVQGGGA